MAKKLATEERFVEYVARLGESVEPMAAKVDPRNVESRHQSMHHFVADAPWEARDVIRVARAWALEQFDRHGPIQAWIIDDTGIPKKGKHSVGVARQYCGVLGKQDNCQVAVSLSVANDVLSVPVAYRLYFFRLWHRDGAARRARGTRPHLRGRRSERGDGLAGREMPAAPKTYSGLGRPPTLLRRLPNAQPVSLVDLALRLPKSAWRSIRWRSGDER